MTIIKKVECKSENSCYDDTKTHKGIGRGFADDVRLIHVDVM